MSETLRLRGGATARGSLLMDQAAAAHLIEIARSQIGTKEHPPNSNRNPYGAALGRDGEPWCAMFVTWCFRQAGATLPDVNGPDGLFTFCPSAVTYARTNSQVVAAPEPGDVLLFDWTGDGTADHVGIFVTANADGSYTTIEGNTASGNDSDGGEVLQRIRWPRQVACAWRPSTRAGTAAVATPDGDKAKRVTPDAAGGPAAVGSSVHPGMVNLTGAVLGTSSTGERVVALQRFLAVASVLLKDLTLAPGTARGTYDAATASAVTSWQRRVGAAADGAWGPQTYAASSAYLERVIPAIVLEQGDAGPEVVLVQRFLVRVAEMCSDPTLDPGGADSEYGPHTAGAVHALQGRVGATQDSDWGPETVSKTAAFLESQQG
jgi:peptidoglycan hydrolase-like protein with peptidoglycan-binding domain